MLTSAGFGPSDLFRLVRVDGRPYVVRSVSSSCQVAPRA